MNSPRVSPRQSIAFTLIELLVTIGIILILAVLGFKAYTSVSNKGRIATSLNNLRQIGAATIQYTSENDGYLPAMDFAPLEQNWAYATYPLIYGKNFPGWIPSSTGENLRGTVYYSPVMKASEGTPLRSYGINYYLTDQSASAGNRRMKLILFNYPSRTILYGDAKGSSALGVGGVQYRNDGKALFYFLDGHVEAKAPADVPQQTTSGDGLRFWRGQ